MNIVVNGKRDEMGNKNDELFLSNQTKGVWND